MHGNYRLLEISPMISTNASKAQAKRNHRSLTKEAVALIERQLTEPRAMRSYRTLRLKADPNNQAIEASIFQRA